MKLSGMRSSPLARAAGVQASTLSRVLRGEHGASNATLFKVESYVDKLLAAQHEPEPELPLQSEPGRGVTEPQRRPRRNVTEISAQIPRRLSAARQVYWPDLDVAAADIGVNAELLARYEAGEETIPADFITLFCHQSGCTLTWVLEGSLEGSDPVFAAWIGRLAPDLIPRARGMWE